MKEKDISARQAALNTALRDNILKKIDTIRENIDDYTLDDFVVSDYQSHEAIKMKMVA